MANTLANFIFRLKYANLDVFKDVVDKYTQYLMCINCESIPEDVAYILHKCSHYLCEKCAKLQHLANLCPKCDSTPMEGNLILDPLYFMFYECYKQRHSSDLSDGTISFDAIKQFRYKLDFLLQDECRRVLKNAGGHMDYIRLFIVLGANPNVLNRDGWTLLHEAVDYENVDVLEALLKGGGLVNAYRLDTCSTCLHDALDEAVINEKLITTLLDYGASINLRNSLGQTPLHKAEVNGNILNLLRTSTPVYNIPIKTRPLGIPLIFGSNLSPKNQKKLNLFGKRFKMKMAKYKISNEVTHVVVEEDPCTPNYDVLMGILQGCFIVTIKWVQDSLEEDSIVDEEEYEINGTTEYPTSRAARQSRINSLYLKPRLFAGGQFKILDSYEERFSPKDKEIITDLVAIGGGKLLVRTKSCGDSIGESFLYHAFGGPLQFCTIVLIHKNEPPTSNWDTIGHASVKWLFKSIQTFTLVP